MTVGNKGILSVIYGDEWHAGFLMSCVSYIDVAKEV
jgi:hypothetical protein